jgi:hypothetical protein
MTEAPKSDTVSLLDGAARLGVSKSMAYRLASAGKPLCEGVNIIRFGVGDRPVYRVSVAQIDAVLAVPEHQAAS